MKKLMVDCTEPELKEKMDSAMRWLLNHLPAGDGPNGRPMVVLLAATFAPGVSQYASNAKRAGIIEFLRETADVLERGEDVTR